MAIAESLRTRGTEFSLQNEDGSYTRIGALSELSKHVTLVPNHSLSLDKMADAKGLRIVSGLRKDKHGIALLCLPGLETYDPPIKHEGNSDAEYGIDMYRYKANDGKENVIFASKIPPHGKTSRPPHTHGKGINGRGVFEHMFVVSGSGIMGESDSQKPMDRYEVVPPETEHGIEAGEEGLVILILLENVEGIPDNQIHIPRTP